MLDRKRMLSIASTAFHGNRCRYLRLLSMVDRAMRKPMHVGSQRRILVIKLDALGDLVLATPFLRELHHAFPAAAITLVARSNVRPLVELCPYVTRIINFDPPSHPTRTREYYAARALKFGRSLASLRFDLALLPRRAPDYYNAFQIAYASAARVIVGYASSFHPACDSSWGCSDRSCLQLVSSNAAEHEVRSNLKLIEATGHVPQSDELELWLSRDDEEAAERWLSCVGLTAGPLVAFGIGAGHAARCWLPAQFARLADLMWSRFSAKILLLGSGASDADRANSILQAVALASVTSAVDSLSIRGTAAILRRCALFIGNDSAPMHLAAAARIPVVEICGLPENAAPTSNFSPVRFGPWKALSRIVRPIGETTVSTGAQDDPTILRINSVELDAVYRAAEELLAEWKPFRGRGLQRTV